MLFFAEKFLHGKQAKVFEVSGGDTFRLGVFAMVQMLVLSVRKGKYGVNVRQNRGIRKRLFDKYQSVIVKNTLSLHLEREY